MCRVLGCERKTGQVTDFLLPAHSFGPFIYTLQNYIESHIGKIAIIAYTNSKGSGELAYSRSLSRLEPELLLL